MENYFKTQELFKTQKNECVRNLNDLIMVNNLYENKKRG